MVDEHIPPYAQQFSAILRQTVHLILDQDDLHWRDCTIRNRLPNMYASTKLCYTHIRTRDSDLVRPEFSLVACLSPRKLYRWRAAMHTLGSCLPFFVLPQ